jgi:hypothetical protein
VQPAQQHGLRMPPFSFESAFSIRILLVSAFLPEVTQQIHSLRARGVMFSHTAPAAGTPVSAFRKSSGILCTTPPASSFRVMRELYQNCDTSFAPLVTSLPQDPSTDNQHCDKDYVYQDVMYERQQSYHVESGKCRD